MARWKSLFRWLIPAAAVSGIILAYPLWFSLLGAFLVRADEPFRADMVVVLAGDSYGNRILKAADLVRQGFAPKALVSGPDAFYGLHECDLAIPFAERAGYPPSLFIPFPNESHSTVEEARAILPELWRLNVKRFIVVTSDYHTRRVHRVYSALAPESEFRVVAAPDRYFTANGWWHNRQGQKTFVLEWEKTIASHLGI